MNHKFITTYSSFVLNETLKTNDIDITIKNINNELSLLHYDFSLLKEENTIHITLNNVNTTQIFPILISNLDRLVIDRHGWFPSKMVIVNINNMSNILKYDEEYLLKEYRYFKTITIVYEPKYDIEQNLPSKLYHLSVQQFEKDILRIGIIPKSKNKLSKHLDRIYLCDEIKGCYELIDQMKIHYLNKKPKLNDKWIIYEIDLTGLDIKLYKDPNYKGGYYCVDNIPKDKIEVIDRE